MESGVSQAADLDKMMPLTEVAHAVRAISGIPIRMGLDRHARI